jgi:hypothetical protein
MDIDNVLEQPRHASLDDEAIDELIEQHRIMWETLQEIANTAGVATKPGQMPDTEAIIRAIYCKFYGGF